MDLENSERDVLLVSSDNFADEKSLADIRRARQIPQLLLPDTCIKNSHEYTGITQSKIAFWSRCYPVLRILRIQHLRLMRRPGGTNSHSQPA